MHHVLHEIAERHRGQTVLAISHGGLMRLTIPLILTREPAEPPARLGNCAVVELRVDDHHWTCVRWPAPAGDDVPAAGDRIDETVAPEAKVPSTRT
jgi:broad specificity phosphatase PhoE